MICVETIGKIRRWHRVDKLSISKIARRLSASRNTIAKYLDSEVTKPKYKTRAKRAPVMGAWVEKLEAMLAEDAERTRKEQRTAQRLHDPAETTFQWVTLPEDLSLAESEDGIGALERSGRDARRTSREPREPALGG